MPFKNDKPCRDCGAPNDWGNALSCPPCKHTRIKAAHCKSNQRPSRKADARRRMARQRAAAYGSRSDLNTADFTGQACSYCGAPAECLDHVVALARGGTDTVDNLVPACAPCNRAKSDDSLLYFLLGA